MSTPPPFAAFPSQWMKHGALLQGLPLTRTLEEFFLRFTTAFWLTSINRYHGFSRVGLARFFPRFSILGDPGGDSGEINCNRKFTLKTTKAFKEINMLFKDLILGHWFRITNEFMNNTILLVAHGLQVMQMFLWAKFLLRGH